MEPSTFAQQNAERAMESANFGFTWTREFAEQTWNRNKAALDGFLKASEKMAKTFESQSSAIREQTTVLTEKALSTSVDFGQKVLRAKEPDELIRLQTEFMAQQAQIFAEQTKELGQKIQSATQTACNTLADAARQTEQSVTRPLDQSARRPALRGLGGDGPDARSVRYERGQGSTALALMSRSPMFAFGGKAEARLAYVKIYRQHHFVLGKGTVRVTTKPLC